MDDLFRILQLRPFQTLPQRIRIRLRYETHIFPISSSTPYEQVIEILRSVSENQNIFVQNVSDLILSESYSSFSEELTQLNETNLDTLTNLTNEIFGFPQPHRTTPDFENDRRRVTATLIVLAGIPNLDPGRDLFNSLLVVIRIMEIVDRVIGEEDSLNNPNIIEEIQNANIILPDLIFPLCRHERAEPPSYRPFLRPVGYGDMFVIKQDILRYEEGEIAHIENIMAGETREREHTRSTTREESILIETESIKEQEKDLQTTERFELSTETNSVIHEDSSLQIGATLTARYGTMVEFTGTTDYSTSSARDESINQASNYAREVVERATQRITERIRKEKFTRVIETFTERNFHGFSATGSQNISGIYQWINKIYRNTVYKLHDQRLMFDYIIPEPGAYLNWLNNRPTEEATPPSPPSTSLDSDVQEILSEASLFGIEVGTPPPLQTIFVSGNLQKSIEAIGDDSPTRTIVDSKIIKIPTGYRATTAHYTISCSRSHTVNQQGEDQLYIRAILGHRELLHEIVNEHEWGNESAGGNYPAEKTIGEANRGDLVYFRTSDAAGIDLGDNLFFSEDENSGGLIMSLSGFSDHLILTVDLSVEIECTATDDLTNSWKADILSKLQVKYESILSKHEDKVSQDALEASFQSKERNPIENRLREKDELKKFSISMLAAQIGWGFNGVNFFPPLIPGIEPSPENNIVQPNLAESRRIGRVVRFFEHAFEWHYLMYILYPYFWGRRNTWADKLGLEGADTEHINFLKSGAARVVIPVRPGFERAVLHFLDCGEIWEGGGEPSITSETYLPIIEEIEDLRNQEIDSNEGESVREFEVKVPTNLVVLRRLDGTIPTLPTYNP